MYCLNKETVEQRLSDEYNLFEDEFYVVMACTMLLVFTLMLFIMVIVNSQVRHHMHNSSK